MSSEIKINYNILTEKGMDPSSWQIRTAVKPAVHDVARNGLSKL
jgi:hypothetical protein